MKRIDITKSTRVLHFFALVTLLLLIILLVSCSMNLDENLSNEDYLLRTYSVIYDSNEATNGIAPIDNNRYTNGSKATILGNTGFLTKTGYGFIGWNSSSDGAGIFYTSLDTIIIGDDDEILYAQWSQNNFSISFDKNDPTAMGSMLYQIIPKNTTVNLNSCGFQKNGWSFIGWSTTPTGTMEYTDNSAYNMGTNDITLYAKWSQNIYSITFDKNDPAATGSMLDQYIAEGYTTLLQEYGFNKDSWTFIGWSSVPGGSVEYQDGVFYTMSSSDIILYAQWGENHTITFDKNDPAAIGSMSKQILAEGLSVNLNTCSYTKINWTFAGWASTSDGVVEYQDNATYSMLNSDITLYAHWRENHAITFDKNDPVAVGSMSEQIIAEGLSVNLNTCSYTKNNWMFIGWSSTPSGSVQYQECENYTMDGSDITLYALWNPVWTTVGTAGFSSEYSFVNGLIFDSIDTPYILFQNRAMKYENSNWISVGSTGFSGNLNGNASLAFDSNDIPYLAYGFLSTKATVKKFIGSSWIVVGSENFSFYNSIGYISIALNSINVPYVAYRNEGGYYKAVLKKFNGVNWESIGSEEGFSQGKVYDLSLAINSNDQPYIVYRDGYNDDKATVMMFNGLNWETVGIAGFSAGIVSNTSLAFDSNDVPFVAYRDDLNNGKATVMKFDGSNWINVGIPGFSEGGVSETTLAIDSNDQPYVGYKDIYNSEKATVMMYTSSNWTIVGESGFSGGSVVSIYLAINSNDQPFVAYRDGLNDYKATVMMIEHP